MADQKISQLTDGGASQATDEYVVARSGNNFRIDGTSVAAAATSIGTLASLTVTGTATIGTVAATNITGGVQQTDIGSAPNEVPLNQYLGTMAYQDAAAVLADTLTVSGDLTVDTSTLKVDSANNRVGVGTASPGYPLDVVGYGRFSSGVIGSAGFLMYGDSSSASGMLLSTSGNLGLGVTPSAWSGATALQVRNSLSLWSQASGSARYANNVFFDGSVRKYIFTGTAAEYEQGGASHAWKIAASGTAGNTITFTTAMTLDASGNLGVGTATFGTSAAKVLGLANATEPSTAVADTIQFYSVDRSAGNTIPALRCEGTGVTDAGITDTTVTNKIAIKVNGTVYYLLATTNAT